MGFDNIGQRSHPPAYYDTCSKHKSLGASCDERLTNGFDCSS
jgi:hypothetical protein